ncbi:MAG: GerAB/ArcD/ProY family transporter [Paenibacillus sp.]|uniref:GerAB/ArcD/ProY family transporter n=1 Tax=Paenibacillus sp. TaxID=58172 RepID=UPI0025EABE37|nr:GerAB/ArcD/ProY family transporter [Paenibacillus sp.]MBR2563760.1 GerAB/ArcD/ProY family transporter [Paenibacillus sp.]
MNDSQVKINTTQTVVIIVNYMLGAGILTLPRTTSRAVGTPDVWISIILSGLIITGVGLIMVTLCRRFPDKNVFQFTGEITGRWIGYILGCATIVYFMVIAAFEIRIMADVTGMYLLERTPTWAIVMVFMWIGIYLISGGLAVIVRVFEVILPITLIIFVMEILLSNQLFEISNLRPVLGEGFMPVIRGLKPSLLSYTGYEVMLVITACMQNPKKSNKAMVWGLGISTSIYLITVVMVVGSLSLDGIKTRTWPTLDLVRSFEIQGLIFERFESLLLVIWIMQIFSTFAITHYLASVGIRDLFKAKRMRTIMYVLLPIIYLTAMIPKNVYETFALGDRLGDLSVILFAITPFILLVVSIIRKKGGTQT